MSTLDSSLSLTSIIGKSPEQVVSSPYELYMCIHSSEIFFIQRYNPCRKCSKEVSRGWRDLQQILCLDCRYSKLPLEYPHPSLNDKQDFVLREIQVDKFEKEGVQVYKIASFSLNLNSSKLLFLPLSRFNKFSEKTEYNLMIYQQDYNGKLHELVARPYGYEKCEKIQQFTLNRTILFDVNGDILSGIQKLLALPLSEGVNSKFFNDIHRVLRNL